MESKDTRPKQPSPPAHLGEESEVDLGETHMQPVGDPTEPTVVPAQGEPPADEQPADSEAPTVIYQTPRPSDEEVVRRPEDVKKYQVKGELARGGMGVIHKVWDDNLKRHLAMKVIRGQEDVSGGAVASVDAGMYERFLREAEITGQLDHPGVVPVHEIGTDESNRTYFTMRLVDGDNLHHIFQLVREAGSAWTQTRALDVMVKVCDTLAFAHSRSVIHRDLKPDNVMVGKFGETYVMDWGLAKIMKTVSPERVESAADGSEDDEHSAHPSYYREGAETMAGSVLGTPAYMAPEQAAGHIGELDNRSDIYAVGTMLYELLAGNRPYRDLDPPPRGIQLLQAVVSGPPTPLPQLAPKCPAELIAVCDKAMQREKGDRYQHIQEMGEDLRAFLEGRVVRAYETGPWAELRKWIGRNRGLAISSLAAVLVAISGLTAVIGVQRTTNRELTKANAKTTKALEQKAAALVKEVKAKQAANEQRRRAEGLYLARRATEAIDTDPGLAILLGREAYARSPNVTTRNALYAAAGALQEVHTLRGHFDRVWRAEFNPDGTRVATVADDGTGAVWDVVTGKRLELLIGHVGDTRSLVWSPDGKYVATGGRGIDSRVAIWNASTGERSLLIDEHAGRIFGLCFSPDNSILATASADKTARLWNTRTGRQIRAFDEQSGVASVCFSPDGSQLAIGLLDGTARIHPVTGDDEAHTFTHQSGGCLKLRFDQSGQRLMTSDRATGSNGHVVYVWNPRTGERIAELVHDDKVTAAEMSLDGTRVVSGTRDGKVRIWNVDTAGVTQTHEFLEPIGALDLARNGQAIAVSAGSDAFVWQFNQTGKPTPLRGHTQDIAWVRFSGDATRVVTAAGDETAKIWVAGSGHLVPRLETGEDGPPQTKLLANDGVVARVYSDKSVYLWSPGTPTLGLQHPQPVVRLIASPTRGGVLTTCEDGKLRWWDTDGKLKRVIDDVSKDAEISLNESRTALIIVEKNEKRVRVLNYSTDTTAEHRLPSNPEIHATSDPFTWVTETDSGLGLLRLRSNETNILEEGKATRDLWIHKHWLVTAPKQRTSECRVWNLETGRFQCRLAGSAIPIRNVTFSPDGARIVANVINSGALHVWNAHTGDRQRDLPGHNAAQLITVQFGTRSDRAISASAGVVRLWSLPDGVLLRTLSEHSHPADRATLSPDGKSLVIGYQGAEIISLWNQETGDLIGDLPVSDSEVGSMLYTEDSEELIVGTRSGQFSRWNLGFHVTPRLVRCPRDLTASEIKSLRPVLSNREFDGRLTRSLCARGMAALRRVTDSATDGLAIRPLMRHILNDLLAAARAAEHGVIDQQTMMEIVAAVDAMATPDPEVLTSLAKLHLVRKEPKHALDRLEQVQALAAAVVDHDQLLNQTRQEYPESLTFSAIDAIAEDDAGRLEGFRETTPAGRYARAVTAIRKKQLAKAIKMFEGIVDDAPRSAEPRLRLAAAYGVLDQPQKQAAVLHDAIRLCPCGYEIWHEWARLCLGELNMSPDQLLSSIPDAPADQINRTGRDPSDELRRVFGQLAANQPIRLNAGGMQLVDSEGNDWLGDALYTDGLRHREYFGEVLSCNSPIRKTQNERVFQSERVFDSRRKSVQGYRIPMPNGTYQVTLHFAELHYNKPGQRVFRVTVEDSDPVNLDLARSGKNTAVEHSLMTHVTDASLDILFTEQRDFPKVSGLEVHKLD